MAETNTIDNLKALKDLIKLIFDIACPIIAQAKKDGKFTAVDLLAFLNSDNFKNEVMPTIGELKDIPTELKAFTIPDLFNLMGFLLSESQDLYTAIKG